MAISASGDKRYTQAHKTAGEKFSWEEFGYLLVLYALSRLRNMCGYLKAREEQNSNTVVV